MTDGATVSRDRNFSGSWQQEHDRQHALEDVQSVTGVDQTLLRLATVGDGWNEVVALPGGFGRMETLTRAAKAVSGPYGSGRLLETPVFSLLILDNGRIIAGAVTPDGLTAAATQIAGAR